MLIQIHCSLSTLIVTGVPSEFRVPLCCKTLASVTYQGCYFKTSFLGLLLFPIKCTLEVFKIKLHLQTQKFAHHVI